MTVFFVKQTTFYTSATRAYVDDVTLISSRFADLQEKTDRLAAIAGIFGLKINPRKTKTLRMSHRSTDYIRIEGEEVEHVESFVYLDSVLDKLGGAAADIKGRLALARNAFTRIQNIWRSGRFSQKTKLGVLNSNFLSVLLYGAEMWRVTAADLNKLDVFIALITISADEILAQPSEQ